MGGNERSVKPSAQPTLVRTQHLPLPAEIAREPGVLPDCGLLLLARRGPAESMRVPLCLAVHGHIADSVRDHEPGRVGGSFRPRRRRQRFTEPLALPVAVAIRRGDGLGKGAGVSWARLAAWSQDPPEGAAPLLMAGRRPEPPLAARRRRPGWLVGDLARASRAHWVRMARSAVARDRSAPSRPVFGCLVMDLTYTCDGPGVYLAGRRR